MAVQSTRTHFDQSLSLAERARAVLPCGAQTLSKAPDQFPFGAYPVYIKRGLGAHVWDVDGHEYIDYPLSLGPILLGHGYSRVHAAIANQLRDGITFSLSHPLEVEVAELLVEMIPCAEAVRFGKTGSDATSSAIRLARAYTGRDRVATCGYHGWHDWYNITTPRNAGVPQVLADLTLTFQYNDVSSLEQLFAEHSGKIAAVIMVPTQNVPPEPGFLEAVREVTRRNGALLIFDEIVTGFRWSNGGAQAHFGVTPDLACLGKGMANGMPLSAVVGPRDIMATAERVFISMTHGGEALSLAAAKATLLELQEQPVIAHIWRQGQRLRDGFNALARATGVIAEALGMPPCTVQVFRDAAGRPSLLLKSLWLQETARRGVLFGNIQYTCYSHADLDIERSLEVAAEAFAVLRKAEESGDPARFLEGELVQEIFVRRAAR